MTFNSRLMILAEAETRFEAALDALGLYRVYGKLFTMATVLPTTQENRHGVSVLPSESALKRHYFRLVSTYPACRI
jgi:hypothetical protein